MLRNVLRAATLTCLAHTKVFCSPEVNKNGNTNNLSTIDQYRLLYTKVSAGDAIFRTSLHDSIIKTLLVTGYRLSDNQFKGDNGPNTRLLQGAKGIGKSTVLKSFETIGAKIFPNIIPVYISYDERTATGSSLNKCSVAVEIVKKLKIHGIHVSIEEDKLLLKSIEDALKKNDKFVLLIVDEIDNLYRVSKDNNPTAFEAAENTLGDLAYLGNTTIGRFGVFLCGSSASCPLLITANRNVDRNVFPLIYGATNLNGKKYSTKRLPVPLCTDLHVIGNILADIGSRNCSEEVCRLVGFTVGVIPRSIRTVLHSCCEEDEEVYGALQASRHESSVDMDDHKHTKGFYRELIQDMKNENGEIMSMLTDTNGVFIYDRVLTQPWETKLKPLCQKQVITAWYRFCEKAKNDGTYTDNMKEDRGLLQRHLFFLADKGLLTYVRIEDALPQRIYPVFLGQFFLDIPENVLFDLEANVTTYLKNHLQAIGGKIIEEVIKQVVGKALQKENESLINKKTN